MFYTYESIRKKVLQELSFDGKKVDEDDQDNDYTQDELAKMFNMSQVSISRLLSRNLKKLKTACKIIP